MTVQGSAVARTAAAGVEQSSFDSVLETMRRHWPGLAVALVLAAVLVYPRWWSVATEPDEGARVPISPYASGAIGFDETLYTSTIRQAYDGILPVSDPYLANHEHDVPQRSAFPHEAIGLLGRVIGDPLLAMAIVTTVAAALALAGLYALGYNLTGSRVVAIALMPVVLVAIHVLNHADGILPLRHRDVLAPLYELEPQRQVHAWARFPAPVLVLAPFFASAIAVPKATESGSGRWMALAVVSLAALVYTYAYYWTAAGLALGAWLAYLWLAGHREQAVRLLRIGGLALLLALPELVILVWAGIDLPADARERLGQGDLGLNTSQGMTILQRIAIGSPFLLALWGGPPRHYLYAALFLSPLVLTPITGVIPQEWHYRTQVWGVFAIPAFIAGGARLVAMFGRAEWSRVAVPAALAAGLTAGVYVAVLQGRAVSQASDGYVITSDEDAAFAWMRENLDGETVVSPSITTNLLLASLSPTSQYIADGGFSTATDEELFERILRVQAAYGYSEDAVFNRLDVSGEFDGFPVNDAQANTREQERLLEDYLAFFTFAFEIADGGAFAARVDDWRPRYGELLDDADVLGAYPAHYLYCGHRERYFGTEEASPGTVVREAFSSGDVAVYEVVADGEPGAFAFQGCG